jgi:hypothetical protein
MPGKCQRTLFHIHLFEHTNSMGRSPSWGANSTCKVGNYTCILAKWIQRTSCIYEDMFKLGGGGGGGELWSLLLSPVHDNGWWVWSNRWSAWQGKPKYSDKTYSTASFPTTNPTWPDLGLNPVLRSGKPASNRLSYADMQCYFFMHACKPLMHTDKLKSEITHLLMQRVSGPCPEAECEIMTDMFWEKKRHFRYAGS